MPDDDKPSSSGGDILPAGTMGVVGELIHAASGNPDVKAAGSELGKAAFTVARAINVVLLPIAAINYGYERARTYFEDRFAAELEEKLADVPADDIIEPKASLAGPIMQGLAFSHDERALRELYLSLLASAMHKDRRHGAHPAFVEIIKQLTAEEATTLCAALAPPETKEIVQVRLLVPGEGWVVLLNHLMDISHPVTRQPVVDPRLPAMVDNWVRLGLVEVSYTDFLANSPKYMRYKWAQDRPEFKRLKVLHTTGAPGMHTPGAQTVEAQPGSFQVTAFGTEFRKALGLEELHRKFMSEAIQSKASPPPAGS